MTNYLFLPKEQTFRQTQNETPHDTICIQSLTT